MRTKSVKSVETIGLDKLKQMLDRGDHFRLVDVREEADYRAGHLPGAIRLAGDHLREEAPEALPSRGEEIVVYGAGPECEASAGAADALDELGYEKVRVFDGGTTAWEAAGYTLEGEEP